MQNLLHFHIPKTGGTALRVYLVDQLGDQHVSPAIAGLQLADANVRWGDMRAVSGHFCVRWGDRLPKDRFNLTVLRDPIDRFLSEFYFIKRYNSGRLLNSKAQMLDLDAYLDALTPSDCEDALVQVGMLFPLGGSLSETPVKLSVNDKVAAAMRAIEDFQLIGVQEELDDFTCVLETRFGWQPKQLGHVMVTAARVKKQELSPFQYRHLQRLLEPELEVYQRAKARFAGDRRDAIRASSARMTVTALVDAASVHEQTINHQKSADERTSQARAVTEFGDKRCVITGVQIKGEIAGGELLISGKRMIISIAFTAEEPIDKLTISLAIRDERGVLVFGTNSLLLGVAYAVKPGDYVARYQMLNRLGPGSYSVDVSLTRNGHRHESCYHWLGKAATFEVLQSEVDCFEGRVMLDPEIDIVEVSDGAKMERLTSALANRKICSLGKRNRALDSFEATISETVPVDTLHAGSDILLPLRIENLGRETWPASGRNPVNVSYHWLDSCGEIVVFDGLRTQLPSDVEAQHAVMVPLQVRVPDERGNFFLQMSLVQEGVAWFVEKSARSELTLPVVVV
jgi:hypothetical protein